MALDKETEHRIDQPIAAEAERETRLTPAEAVEQMRINVPVRGNRKLRTLIERVNEDKQLKAWWHASNINAGVRMQINDHSWVHIQIVANIALKLLRQLTKHGVEPSLVSDYGLSRDDSEIVVVLAALLHCIGMSVHREGHEDFSLFLAEPKMREVVTTMSEKGAMVATEATGPPVEVGGVLRGGVARGAARTRAHVSCCAQHPRAGLDPSPHASRVGGASP